MKTNFEKIWQAQIFPATRLTVRHLPFLLTLCAVFLITSPAAKANGPYKAFKEWNVNCSAALVCSLLSYIPSDENAKPGENLTNFIEFKRGTKANAPLELIISFNSNPNEETDLLLSVPGQLEEYYLPFSNGDLVEGSWVFPPGDLISKLLPALGKGEQLILSAETNEGDATSVVPLSGVTASLIFLDEAQGRVDHTDALIARGNLAAQDVFTRVSDILTQDDLPDPIMEIWSNRHNDCKVEDDDVLAQFGGMSVTLSNNGVMYLLPCNLPGAYNAPYIALMYHSEQDTARTLAFPVIGAQGPTILDYAYNLFWNDKSSQLSAFYKGRGIGDCGSRQIWTWAGDEPYGEFELLEERVKEDCDGKHDEFPLVWPPD